MSNQRRSNRPSLVLDRESTAWSLLKLTITAVMSSSESQLNESSSHSDTALQFQAVPRPGELLDDDMKQLIQLMQGVRYENGTLISPVCPPDFALGASFPKDHVMSALVKLQEEVIDFSKSKLLSSKQPKYGYVAAHLVEKNVVLLPTTSILFLVLRNSRYVSPRSTRF